jgi:hypothetical protein
LIFYLVNVAWNWQDDCMSNIDQLRQQARELRKLAKTLDEAADGLERLGGGLQPIQMQSNGATPSSRIKSKDLCFTVIRDAGHPLHKNEIMERLVWMDRKVSDGTLLSYLSREKKRLVSLGKGRWTLAEWQKENEAA